MDVLRLVLRSRGGVERVDLHEHLFVRLLCTRMSAAERKNMELGRTCFLCWSSSLEPSYRFRFDRFSILACEPAYMHMFRT